MSDILTKEYNDMLTNTDTVIMSESLQDIIDERQFSEDAKLVDASNPSTLLCYMYLKDTVIYGSLKSFSCGPKGRVISIMTSPEDAAPLISDSYIENISCINSRSELQWELECDTQAHVNIQFYDNQEALIFVTIPFEKHT